MTREEAIRQLDGADIAVLNRDFFKFNQAIIMAISALRQQERFGEANKTLTMDELRKMDGEPVWVQSPGVPEYGRWAIVEGVGENCLFLHDDFTCHDYGKTWLAYRQKKEV